MEPSDLNELLIVAVQKRQALYNKAEDNYSNRVHINRQWKEIGEELGINGKYLGVIANDYKAVAEEVIDDIRSGSIKASAYLTGLAAAGLLFYSNPSARDLDCAIVESAHDLSLVGKAIRNKESDEFVDTLCSAQREGRLHHTNLGFLSLVWLSDNRSELDLYEAKCKHVHLPWYQFHKRVVDVGILGKFITLSRKMENYDINFDE